MLMPETELQAIESRANKGTTQPEDVPTLAAMVRSADVLIRDLHVNYKAVIAGEVQSERRLQVLLDSFLGYADRVEVLGYSDERVKVEFLAMAKEIRAATTDADDEE